MSQRSLLLVLALVLISIVPIRATCQGHCGYADGDDWYYPTLADVQQYHWYNEVDFFLNDFGEESSWGPAANAYGSPVPFSAYPAYNSAYNPAYNSAYTAYNPSYNSAYPAYNPAYPAYYASPALNQSTGDNTTNWLNEGDKDVSTGSYEQAAVAYANAMKLDPFLPVGWLKMGYALYALGRYQDSLNAYDAVLKLDPQNKDALAAKRNVLFALNLTDKANEILESLKKPQAPALA